MYRLVACSFAVVTLALGSGCSMPAGQAPAKTAANGSWESVTLADGIELRVSPEAGPAARKVAEDIQSEMRSRYIGAR